MSYKEIVDKKNKTIHVEYHCNHPYYHSEYTYTQKELIKGVKKLIKDFLNGKVKEGTNYDYDEWCNPMLHKLKLLEKIL